MLGVSFDSVEANRRFAEKQCFTFKLLSDLSKEMCVAYGASAPAPLSYAQRVSYLIGPEATVLEAYPNVSPSSHAAEVLVHIAKHASAAAP